MKQFQWVSVKDSLPGYDEYVLVAFRNPYPDGDDWHFCFSHRPKDKDVKVDNGGWAFYGWQSEIEFWARIPNPL